MSGRGPSTRKKVKWGTTHNVVTGKMGIPRAGDRTWSNIARSFAQGAVQCVGSQCLSKRAMKKTRNRINRAFRYGVGEFGSKERIQLPPEELTANEEIEKMEASSHASQLQSPGPYSSREADPEEERRRIARLATVRGPQPQYTFTGAEPRREAIEPRRGNEVMGPDYVPPASGGTRKRKHKRKHKHHHCSKKCFRHTGK